MARQDRVVRLANQNEVLALLLNDHCAGLTRSDPWHLFFWAKDPGLDGDTPSLLLLSDNTIMPPGPQRIHTYPETIRAHAVYRFRIRMDSLRSEEHTSELQSRRDLVCRLLLEKKKKNIKKKKRKSININ